MEPSVASFRKELYPPEREIRNPTIDLPMEDRQCDTRRRASIL